jgi:uncharacterized protein
LGDSSLYYMEKGWHKMIDLYRFELDFLTEWLGQKHRKPLVIKGARQVGKSTLVKLFAERQDLNLLTVDFEKDPDNESLFTSNEPKKIISMLNERTLLFMDEVQKTPNVLLSLRYFYEEMPELPIICAGSLLDLALTQINFSMPVGRISYLYMGPMSFQAFLIALGQHQLLEFLRKYTIDTEMPLAIHKQLNELMNVYCIVGGLPESVRNYAENHDFLETEKVKQALISGYKDDFAKYATSAQQQRMRQIFTAVPKMLGEKFKASNINRDDKSTIIKEALEKLVLAKIIIKVCTTHANGLPLGAEENLDFFKTYFLDIGLVCSALDLSVLNFMPDNNISLINAGKIAEQFIAQHLLYLRKYYETPALYYWAREQKSSAAEIDFLFAHNGKIVPIEVKAGAGGTLKSLHYFLHEKNLNLGVKFSSLQPNISHETVKLTSGGQCNYTLLSLPLYMVEELPRILNEYTKLNN